MLSIKRLVKRFEKYMEIENSISDKYRGLSSFYLLPNGKFLNCKIIEGERTDHREIFEATDIEFYGCMYEYEKWEELHKKYRLVRIVPETKMLLIYGKQRLTEEQKKSIENYLSKLEFKLIRY